MPVEDRSIRATADRPWPPRRGGARLGRPSPDSDSDRRESELLGLWWEDLDLSDLNRATIRFEYQVDRQGRRVELKTDESKAVLPLPRAAAAMLLEQRRDRRTAGDGRRVRNEDRSTARAAQCPARAAPCPGTCPHTGRQAHVPRPVRARRARRPRREREGQVRAAAREAQGPAAPARLPRSTTRPPWTARTRKRRATSCATRTRT